MTPSMVPSATGSRAASAATAAAAASLSRSPPLPQPQVQPARRRGKEEVRPDALVNTRGGIPALSEHRGGVPRMLASPSRDPRWLKWHPTPTLRSGLAVRAQDYARAGGKFGGDEFRCGEQCQAVR